MTLNVALSWEEITPTDNDNKTSSKTRLRKSAVRKLLASRDKDTILDWGGSDPQALRTLSSMLFETDSLLRWRAVEALGLVAGQVYQRDPDPVRRLISRLLWLMNDESGGLCWHAPEAIAEIILHIESLVEEYSQILLSFLYEEPFEIGVRLGIARLAAGYLDTVKPACVQLLQVDNSRTPEIALSSIFALKALGVTESGMPKSVRLTDAVSLEVYNFTSGSLENVTPEVLPGISLNAIGYGQP